MKRPAQLLLIAVAFDVYWTLVVVFRERGIFLWLALAILACLMLPHTQRRDALLLALAGSALDTAWVLTGLIKFNSTALLPLWMVALWLMFATVWSRLTSMTTLSRWLLVLSGTVGGPVAYAIGEYLGAITFLEPTAIVLSWMVCGWLVLMLIFHVLMRRLQCVR
jgi:hypothetical protein